MTLHRAPDGSNARTAHRGRHFPDLLRASAPFPMQKGAYRFLSKGTGIGREEPAQGSPTGPQTQGFGCSSAPPPCGQGVKEGPAPAERGTEGLGAKGKGPLMVTPEQPRRQTCPLEGPEPAAGRSPAQPPFISLPNSHFMSWRLMSREEPITETAWIQSALPSSVPRIKSNHPILPRSSLLVCKTRNKCTDPAALPEPGEVLILFIRGNIFFPPRGVCSLGKEGENGLWCWYYSSSANVLWTQGFSAQTWLCKAGESKSKATGLVCV